MTPQKRAKAKISTTEAAAGPNTPRAKRSRTSVAVEPSAEAAEEEANNSMHGDIVGSDTRPVEASLPWSRQVGPPPGAVGVSQGSYKALQRELADLRREMADLRHPLETALAAPLRPLPTTTAEAAPSAPAMDPLALLLRGGGP